MWITLFILIMAVFLTSCAEQPAASEAVELSSDFSLTSLDGQNIRLSDYRGKVVLVNFWATWCQPCLEEMSLLQATAVENADRLVVLGINMREDTAAVTQFTQAHGITFPLLMTPDDQTLIDYGIMGLPITMIVGPDGEIVQRVNGMISAQTIQTVLDRYAVIGENAS